MGLLWSIFITFQISFALLSERFYAKCNVRTAEKHWSFFKYPFHHPTNRKKVALMCHNKNYLVLMNGKLKGSVDPKIIRKYGEILFNPCFCFENCMKKVYVCWRKTTLWAWSWRHPDWNDCCSQSAYMPKRTPMKKIAFILTTAITHVHREFQTHNVL